MRIAFIYQSRAEGDEAAAVTLAERLEGQGHTVEVLEAKASVASWVAPLERFGAELGLVSGVSGPLYASVLGALGVPLADATGWGALDGAGLKAVLGAVCARLGLESRSRASASRPLRVGLIYNLKRIKPRVGSAEDREAEYDSQETIDALASAIASYGHEVVRVEATASELSALGGRKLDVAFNLAEGVRGRSRESLVPALLELHNVAYTGSDAATMALALDKGLAKRIVREAGVPTAPFVVMYTAKDKLPKELGWPVIIKPLAEGSSKGVSGPSVVHDEETLREVVGRQVDRYRQPVLVEGFLSGREFTVGVLQDRRLEVLPPMEIVFSAKAGPDPIYTFEHKLEFNDEVRYACPAEVDAALGKELVRVAKGAFQALGCRDVARIDLRMDKAGRVNFIECNPLPGLTPEWSDLCIIAKAAGLSYEALIGRILAPAIRRRKRGAL